MLSKLTGAGGRAALDRIRAAAREASTEVTAVVARIPPPAAIWVLTLGSLYLAYRHASPCADGLSDGTEVWRVGCYNDIQPLYSGRLLNEGAVPYLDHDPTDLGHNVEYPVLIGAFMALVGLPVHALAGSGRLASLAARFGSPAPDEGLVFFWATAAVLAVLALVATWGLLQCRRDRPWDLTLWALAPALMLEATINWDMLAVALTVLALAAWSRERPGLAGVLLGLGAAAKLYPLVILGPLVLLCLRAGTRRAKDAAVRLVTSAFLAWVGVNLPIAIMSPDGWAYPYRFSSDRWIDWGSLWYVLDQVTQGIGGHEALRPLYATHSELNRSSVALFGLACLGIALLIRYAPRPPRVAAMAFLVVACFLLTNKVWSPQFVMWLLPLAVLARPRWGWFLVWQAAEGAYLFGVMRVVLDNQDGYILLQAAVMRWVAVAVLAGLVVVEALHPDRDVVLAGGGEDPEGGVLRPREHRPPEPWTSEPRTAQAQTAEGRTAEAQAAEPVASGPVASGPVTAGPVTAGPVTAGPTGPDPLPSTS